MVDTPINPTPPTPPGPPDPGPFPPCPTPAVDVTQWNNDWQAVTVADRPIPAAMDALAEAARQAATAAIEIAATAKGIAATAAEATKILADVRSLWAKSTITEEEIEALRIAKRLPRRAGLDVTQD